MREIEGNERREGEERGGYRDRGESGKERREGGV